MTESESLRMIEAFRVAWPESALDTADATEIAKLFRAYQAETVEGVIADRIEADLPMPARVELSRILRFYAPGTASDPQPVPESRRPASPWIRDLETAPPVPNDLSERLAAIRAQMEHPSAPAPAVAERDPDPEFAARIDELRRCAEVGRKQGALDRRARLDAAKAPT